MKQLTVLVFSLIAIFAFGQGGEVVFTVKAKVYLTPVVDTLFAGKTYSFNVKGLALKDITAAAVDNGKVSVTATEIKLRPNNPFNDVRQDTLVLMINKNGKQEEVLRKVFTVIKLQELIITDSVMPATAGRAIELYWLSAWPIKTTDSATVDKVRNSGDRLFAMVPTMNTLPVIISYKMDVNCMEKVVKFAGKSNVITAEMLTALKRIEAGCVVKLYDVQCTRPGSSNDLSIIGPFSILVTE